MTHRTVREVMTAPVITAAADTPFKELAALMARHRISALPVRGAGGAIVGVISEIDLLRKEEFTEDPQAPPPPHWRHAGRARAAGLTAADAMTSPPVTIEPGASVVAAARLMDRHRIHHLLVLGPGGSAAGIVTPRDLLQVYLRPDAEIRDEIIRDVITGYLGTDPARVTVTVSRGQADLSGQVENRSMVDLAVRRTRAVDGVVGVTARLSYVADDRHPPFVHAPGYPGENGQAG